MIELISLPNLSANVANKPNNIELRNAYVEDKGWDKNNLTAEQFATLKSLGYKIQNNQVIIELDNNKKQELLDAYNNASECKDRKEDFLKYL